MANLVIVYRKPATGSPAFVDVSPVAIMIPAPGIDVNDVLPTVPAGATDVRVIDQIAELPVDRLFRDAWDISGIVVKADIIKAGNIAHSYRRNKRDEEFAPYDDIIAKQIPGNDAAAAEIARAGIRSKYDTMQVDMDAAIIADDETLLRNIMTANSLI